MKRNNDYFNGKLICRLIANVTSGMKEAVIQINEDK